MFDDLTKSTYDVNEDAKALEEDPEKQLPEKKFQTYA
jgi:hypothetical protein